MKSRLSRYDSNENLSRVNKNQNLYDDMYSDTNYSNMVVIDDSNEIDISKIKEIIDKENNRVRRIEKNNFNKEEYDSIVPKKQEERSYDINEILKEAKSKRGILEEALEKSKIENYKFNDNIEEELSKTRTVYENLIKEEKELLNLMNTMSGKSSVDIANDMFQDLTSDKNLTEVLDEKPDVNIKQIDEDSAEYSTDTFMFNTKDFEGIDDLRDNLKKTNIFIKVLIFIVVLAILSAGVFIVLNKF